MLAASTYLGWFGCVYLGKIGWEFATLIFPILSWYLLNKSFAINSKMLYRLVILTVIGVLFDYSALHFGLISLITVDEFTLLPIWLISLWVLFASSLPLMQSFLRNKLILSSIIGGIFGPLSYHAGSSIGVLELNGNSAYLTYIIFWAIYTPLAILWLTRRDASDEN